MLRHLTSEEAKLLFASPQVVSIKVLAGFHAYFALPRMGTVLLLCPKQLWVKATEFCVSRKILTQIFQSYLEKCQSLRTHEFTLLSTALHFVWLASNGINIKTSSVFKFANYNFIIFLTYTLYSLVEKMKVQSSNGYLSFVVVTRRIL